MTFPLALAAVTLVVWAGIALTVIYSELKVLRLEEVAPPRADDPPPPRLSVIVAARNEERSVEEALRSLLALRYPDFEVLFVNDRSEDRTGEIAVRLAGDDDRLSVIEVKELPAGWFGKNHAAQRGADAAVGSFCSSPMATSASHRKLWRSVCGISCASASTISARAPESWSAAACFGLP
ncbi:glycosyltransferase family 2 protein [Candidatus Palauibacter sp.]|uniref:glycosyltransferase family 2 protein n=1 Tax=Candidatus Palauibacter sp. TaxID=3101350 RepID=UPI003B52E96E